MVTAEKGKLGYWLLINLCFVYLIGVRIICSLSRLLELARRKCTSDGCNSQCNISYKKCGCCLLINGICECGHTFTWESPERLLNQSISRLYQDNLCFASAVLLSGNNFTKVELLCQFLGVPIISKSTFHSYQRNFICPAINKHYTTEQVRIEFLHEVLHTITALARISFWLNVRVSLFLLVMGAATHQDPAQNTVLIHLLILAPI